AGCDVGQWIGTVLDRLIGSLFRGFRSAIIRPAPSRADIPQPVTRLAAQPAADASGRAYFDIAGDQTRDAAKWILASFAAIGASLIVGVQLSDIGTLTGGRLFGAILALIFGFLGIVVAIRAVLVSRCGAGRWLVKGPGYGAARSRGRRSGASPSTATTRTVGDDDKSERVAVIDWSGVWNSTCSAAAPGENMSSRRVLTST